MLAIRLTRRGKKNQPFFKVVVIDKRRSAKGGRAVEELGYVNPLTKKKSLKKERILYWISKGAKPSPRVHNLLVSEKIINAKKINVLKKLHPVKSAEGGVLLKAEQFNEAGKVIVQQSQVPVPQIKVDSTQINADTKVEALVLSPETLKKEPKKESEKTVELSSSAKTTEDGGKPAEQPK